MLSAVLIVLNVFGAGSMVFTFPQTLDQAFVMLVPFLTLIIGLLLFLFPRRILHFCGVEAIEGKPHAIGEGRSSYAGILIACGAGCLFLQEPALLQPGLSLMLAASWLIAGFGVMIQGLVDDGLDFRVFGRMFLFLTMGSLTLQTAELVGLKVITPETIEVWVVSLIAFFTMCLGLIALFLPKLALKILNLRPKSEYAYAIGESRGILAGFYISLGAAPLIFDVTFIYWLFLSIILGAAWLFTGIGRLVSIVVDKGLSRYNFAGLIFEIGVGGLTFAMIYRLI